MPDNAYVLISDEDFEALEAAEKYLQLAYGLIESTTTAPHLMSQWLKVGTIIEAISEALTADAQKDAALEAAIEASFRDDTPTDTQP